MNRRIRTDVRHGRKTTHLIALLAMPMLFSVNLTAQSSHDTPVVAGERSAMLRENKVAPLKSSRIMVNFSGV